MLLPGHKGEVFCLAAEEARELCIPIVTLGYGSLYERVIHNKTGFICDGNDLNSIYDSVIEYFENDKFIKFGHSAKIFSENFHWDKVVKNYLKLIN